MGRRSKFVFSLLVILVLQVLTGCGSDVEGSKNDQVVMKFTHGTGTDGIWQKTAEKFSELVDEYSDGKVKVEIYPGGQIGSGEKSMEDIQNGLIEATSESVNNLTPFAPSLGMFDLPYLFEDSSEYAAVVDELGEKINERVIEESGLRVITWLDKGIRAVGTIDKEINTIDDLQGSKIRVPKNPIQLASFESWGVNATPIAWDETITSLQQGVIDGLELAYDDFESTKIYENINYISDVGYKYDVAMVVIGEDWFQQQTPEIQDAVIKAGQETTEWTRESVQGLLDESKKVMEDHVTFTGPPKDEEVWKEKALKTWPKQYNRIKGTDLLTEVMNVVGRDLPQ
ncbi:hypothetical protein CSV79_09295 [Sporosarcina sp. P13]|uniref:TRAP transporter substrate-binding protein n=1 Tax=Sporosarcina sp. P13 TaxID=2048263 RepID=UPI000C16EBD7|nr:TRAP transporter substrate-binding protein [Sporosarcina sp. P13]PIC63975.1 hypothetical protein CSV79_09295 [Sporosarcina sp. P13]